MHLCRFLNDALLTICILFYKKFYVSVDVSFWQK